MKIVKKIKRYRYLFLDFIDALLRRLRHESKPIKVTNLIMTDIKTGKVVLHIDNAKATMK